MKFLLTFTFPFLRSGVEAGRGVEFCLSARNASGIQQKVGNGIQREADKIKVFLFILYFTTAVTTVL